MKSNVGNLLANAKHNKERNALRIKHIVNCKP